MTGIFGFETNPIFSNPSDAFKERIECINNPDFVSKDNNYKFCIRNNGEILKINKEGQIINIKGQVDKILKNKKIKFIVTTTTLIEYKIENEELIEYKCKAKKIKSQYLCEDSIQRYLLGIRPYKYFLEKALLNIENKSWQKALQNLKNEIQISNSNEAYYYLSFVNFKTGDMVRALEIITSILNEEPENIRFLNLSSYIKLILEDHNGAINDLNKLLDLEKIEKVNYKIEDRDLFWNKLYFRRALSKSVIGDRKGAITDIEFSINLNPNLGYAYVQKGLELFFDDKKEACENILKGLNLGANDKDIKFLSWDNKFFDSCKSFNEMKDIKNNENFLREANKKEIINLFQKYIFAFPILALLIVFLFFKYSSNDE